MHCNTHIVLLRRAYTHCHFGPSNAEDVFSGTFANKSKNRRKFVWQSQDTHTHKSRIPSHRAIYIHHASVSVHWNLVFTSLYSRTTQLSMNLINYLLACKRIFMTKPTHSIVQCTQAKWKLMLFANCRDFSRRFNHMNEMIFAGKRSKWYFDTWSERFMPCNIYSCDQIDDGNSKGVFCCTFMWLRFVAKVKYNVFVNDDHEMWKHHFTHKIDIRTEHAYKFISNSNLFCADTEQQ